MRTPSPSYCRLDLAPPLADRFLFGVAPIDYSPVLLLMPFGFHLTMDTLPSGELQADGFRSALACVRLSLSCPFRLLHTFHLLRPARHYPRVRIWRSSFERQRDFNPPEQCAAQRTLRAQSDSSRACVSALWLITFADRSRSWLVRDVLEISRFSCMLFHSVRGFFDYPGPTGHSRFIAVRRLAFPRSGRSQRPVK